VTIEEEFERLRLLAATKEGWRQLEDGWMRALNLPFPNITTQDYDLSLGFAIDAKFGTWLYEIGKPEDKSHGMARIRLRLKLLFDKELPVWHESDLVEGRLANVIGWQFPFIYLMRLWERNEELSRIEAKLIEQGIGLPLNCLWIAHTEQEEV